MTLLCRVTNIVNLLFMENKEQHILSEIKAMMSSIRSQLENLDAKMAELQQIVSHDDESLVPIDIELDDVSYDASSPLETSAAAPVVEDNDSMFAGQEDGQPVEPVVAMAAQYPWRTDMPGTMVKDIRSAISLNDRILFINTLFKQDPMAFQNVLTQINQMSSLSEAESYLMSECPDWNFDSETVYRFMMAVRRRLR